MKHFLPVILSLTILTACVDKSYDLSRLDGEVSILPGLELDIPQVFTYKAADVFGFSQNPSVQTDEAGYYNLVSDRQVILNDSYPEDRIEAGIDLDYYVIIPFKAEIPDIFKKEDPKLSVPRIDVFVDFDNPCPYSVEVSYKVQVENVQKVVSFVAPPQSSKCYESVIDNSFRVIPPAMNVLDIRIKKSGSYLEGPLAQAYNFHMDFGSRIPLEVASGARLDLTADINPLGSALVMNTKKAEIDITVRNYFGLAMDIESYNPVVPEFSLAFDPISPSTGIVPGRIVAECERGLKAARDSVTTVVHFRNDSDRPVKITKDSYLSITAKSITFPEGLYFE